MTDIKHTIIAHTVKAEGGYIDDPDDRGGKTIYGITEAVARRNGYKDDMRDMPLNLACHIYATQYWDPQYLDHVADKAPRLAVHVFNTGVTSGIKRSGIIFQHVLNSLNYKQRYGHDLHIDGIIGLHSLTVFDAFITHRKMAGASVMADIYAGCRMEFYSRLGRSPSYRKFVYGWTRRTAQENTLCF